MRKYLFLPLSALPSVGLFFIVLISWFLMSRYSGIPEYLIPGPVSVGRILSSDWSQLASAMIITLELSLAAFFISVVMGLLLSFTIVQSRIIEKAVMPYVVLVQIIPFVAISPLIQLWTGDIYEAVIVLGVIASIFPIVSNSILGLRSIDRNLHLLFSVYSASRWQRLWRLLVPGATPNILNGMVIGITLSLIGVVTGQFILSNNVSNGGISYVILQSEYGLETPLMFAALFVLTIVGVTLYLIAKAAGRVVIGRWHQSEQDIGPN